MFLFSFVTCASVVAGHLSQLCFRNVTGGSGRLGRMVRRPASPLAASHFFFLSGWCEARFTGLFGVPPNPPQRA
jgi:hypothetical protein